MENKLLHFIYSTKLGVYVLVVYMFIYFSAVFITGLDHAAQRDLAHQHMEKLSELSFYELGNERVKHEVDS